MKKRVLVLIVGFFFIGVNGFAADGDLIVNGNVGIGTTTPVKKLDVEGNFRWGTGDYIGELDQVTNFVTIGAYSNHGLELQTNSTGKVWIDTIGNVGIGTTNPYGGFHIKRSGQALNLQTQDVNHSFDIQFYDADDTSGSYKWDLSYRGNVGDGDGPNSLKLFNSGGGGLVMAWQYSTGNVSIGTGDPGAYKLYVNGTAYSTGGWQSSDLRFKENIMPIESPLNKILNMEGISFDWKRDEFKDKGFPEGKHYGVVAQKIEKVLPEVVKEGPGGEKSVSYTELVPVLIEAMKEQQKEINELKAEIDRLKGNIHENVANLQP